MDETKADPRMLGTILDTKIRNEISFSSLGATGYQGQKKH